MLQATSTIAPSPSSTFSISPTSTITNVTITPAPSQCSCNSSSSKHSSTPAHNNNFMLDAFQTYFNRLFSLTAPSCGKEIKFHNRTLKHYNTATNKTYHCQSKKALRNVTCSNTCNRKCPTDSSCGIDIDCTVDAKLKIKKFNCNELDSRGNILSGAESVLLRLRVTMYTGCICKRGHCST